MLTYYYIYDIVEPMSMEAITLKAYSKGSLKGTMKRSLGIQTAYWSAVRYCLLAIMKIMFLVIQQGVSPFTKKTIIGAIINTDKRIKEVMNAMVMMTNEIKKNHEMSTLNSAMIKESGDTILALVKKVKKLEKEVAQLKQTQLKQAKH
ncbi:hypothetical protein ACR9LA_00170 [Helicobacter pylori]